MVVDVIAADFVNHGTQEGLEKHHKLFTSLRWDNALALANRTGDGAILQQYRLVIHGNTARTVAGQVAPLLRYKLRTGRGRVFFGIEKISIVTKDTIGTELASCDEFGVRFQDDRRDTFLRVSEIAL